jgi:Amt family ammonium transporter
MTDAPSSLPAAPAATGMFRKAIAPLALLTVGSLVAAAMPPTEAADTSGINAGDTAWMLTATALVLLMTPGLSFFYGGMVRPKNVISTMLQSFIAMSLVSLVGWLSASLWLLAIQSAA